MRDNVHRVLLQLTDRGVYSFLHVMRGFGGRILWVFGMWGRHCKGGPQGVEQSMFRDVTFAISGRYGKGLFLAGGAVVSIRWAAGSILFGVSVPLARLWGRV